MVKDITFISLSYMGIFILPILILFYKLKILLIKDTLTSIFRMFVQLTLVGIYLQYIFRWNNPIINLIYLFIMIMFSAFSTGKSVDLKLSRIFPIIILTTGVPLLIVLIFFNSVLIGLTNPFEATYLIPISGMLLGNSLKGNIITLNTFFKTFRGNEDEYLYSLGMGARKYEALLPYIKEALFSSIAPAIAAMATLGIVSLPGMMTGQILGGSLPLTAIKYQIAVMLAIFSTTVSANFLGLLGVTKLFFNEYHLLDKSIFSKS